VTKEWGKVSSLDDREKQVYQNLGTYEKKLHAMQALNSYHNQPETFLALLELHKKRQVSLEQLLSLERPKTGTGSLIANDTRLGTTLEQLFLLWEADEGRYGLARKSDKTKKDFMRTYDEHFQDIKKIYVKDLTIQDMQRPVDRSDKSINNLRFYKILLNSLFEYAISQQLIPKEANLTSYIDLSNVSSGTKMKREAFSLQEIETLWGSLDKDEYVSVVLMLIYSGLRINELLKLKKENVYLEDRYMITGSKTDAGRDRRVPIAEKVVRFYEYWMRRSNNEYLISVRLHRKNKPVGDVTFRNEYWKPLMAMLGMDHTPHDTRHTTAKLLATAEVDRRWVNQILGHAGSDLAESTYTNLEVKPLLTAINKI